MNVIASSYSAAAARLLLPAANAQSPFHDEAEEIGRPL